MAGFSAISSKLKEMYQVSLPRICKRLGADLPLADDHHGR
jgi:hypothetical protein